MAYTAKNKVDASHGFDAGNFANAYETEDLDTALAKLSMNRSEIYVNAFILGFCSAQERHEMSEDMRGAYDTAMQSVGTLCQEIGIALED
jgi:hypothetical protein